MASIGVRIIDPNKWISKAQIKKLKDGWKNKTIDDILPQKQNILQSIHFQNTECTYSKLTIYKDSKENYNVFSFEKLSERDQLREKLKNKTANNRMKGKDWHIYNTLRNSKMPIMSPDEIKNNPQQTKQMMEIMEKMNQTNNKLYDYYTMCANKD